MMNIAFNFSQIDLKIDSALRVAFIHFIFTYFLVLPAHVFNCAIVGFDSF